METNKKDNRTDDDKSILRAAVRKYSYRKITSIK